MMVIIYFALIHYFKEKCIRITNYTNVILSCFYSALNVKFYRFGAH